MGLLVHGQQWRAGWQIAFDADTATRSTSRSRCCCDGRQRARCLWHPAEDAILSYRGDREVVSDIMTESADQDTAASLSPRALWASGVYAFVTPSGCFGKGGSASCLN